MHAVLAALNRWMDVHPVLAILCALILYTAGILWSEGERNRRNRERRSEIEREYDAMWPGRAEPEDDARCLAALQTRGKGDDARPQR
jgi:hypothetical protein